MEEDDLDVEGGGGSLSAIGEPGWLTQEYETGGTAPINACSRFNNLRRLYMLWMVQHRCLVGVRFAFNCYKHWAHLLLRLPSKEPVLILSQEGVVQNDPLPMVLYGITLVPLAGGV